MMVRQSQLTVFAIFVMWLFAVSGTIGIMLGMEEWFLPKTPINLLLLTSFLFLCHPIRDRGSLLIFILAFLTGMVVEIIGVKTGVIFGQYSYGINLGPKLWEVPILIGINWAMLTFACVAIARRLTAHRWAAVMIGSILMVAFDVTLEGVAGKMDYWHWEGSVVPLKNYLAWLMVSVFLQWSMNRWAHRGSFRFAIHLYLSQFLFLLSGLLFL